MSKSSTLRLAEILLRVGRRAPLLVGCAVLAACAHPREWRISGVCTGPNQEPREGIVVTQIEIGRSLPIGAVLPPETRKATAITDRNGRFTLVVRSSRPWALDVNESPKTGFVPGSARIKVPEELLERRELSMQLTIDHGRITNKWER